jgi:hypothetical protein
MANPAFYIDNVRVLTSQTTFVRGNVVSDLVGDTVVGITAINNDTLRAKNNRVVRVRSPLGQATGFNIQNSTDTLLVYNVASRTNTGFSFSQITTLDVYNLTAHNCNLCATVAASGDFYNIAFSAYEDNSLYKVSNGFRIDPPFSINLDYCIHHNLANLVQSGTVNQGSNVSNNQILYFDEQNDDLTPDYISILVNSGTPNPINANNADIGGLESEITDEETADRKYWYNLIDNSFWDIDNEKSVEATFIKAFQSRVLADSQLAARKVKYDSRIKTADSNDKFAPLYPMNMRYQNKTKFMKNVMDMWYSGQNCGTLQAYQNSIGGYNLLPSFLKRMEDYEECWVIGSSYIDYDDWLLGWEEYKYGIGIDVLGLSTLSQGASGECYNNVMRTVADIAPVRWFLHDEVQPSGYVVFTDMYNGFENCTLTNMFYNDDFNISTETVGASGQILTPLISTLSLNVSGTTYTELSLLDRVWSENISRTVYFRQGASVGTMGAWEEISDLIGGIISINSAYIQFLLTVDGVLRQIDYEFMGLALRPYTSVTDWTKPTS